MNQFQLPRRCLLSWIKLIPSCRQPAITTGVARASAVLPIASLFLDVARVDPKGMLFLAKVLTTTAQCLNLVNAL